jgi:hypothetical protein
MFKLINGWTKETVLAQVKKYNNGTKAIREETGHCAYKTAQGNRCAVGAFIPDGHTAALNSSASGSGMIENFPELKPFMPFSHEVSCDGTGAIPLNVFQKAHDGSIDDNVYESIKHFLDTKVEG